MVSYLTERLLDSHNGGRTPGRVNVDAVLTGMVVAVAMIFFL